MSKIGKKPINILAGVEIKLQGNILEVKGPKGSLSLEINPLAKVEIKEKEILVSQAKKTKEAGAIWGLTRSLIDNLIIGVAKGYEKKLELQGVGYRMNIQGSKIVMALGFSHPVEKEIPQDLTVKLEENNLLSVWGIDKQRVGQFSAEVRNFKKAEPYKGKGFRYQGEQVRRKVGKKAAVAK